MWSNLAPVIAEMMENPPDPNGPVPISNQRATMYGATIPFHVLAWVAVSARLYTRFKVVHDPGWDDVFIILAAIFNLLSMVTFLGCIQYGLGQHLGLLNQNQLLLTMKWVYPQNAAYYTTTALVKISLLLQYLRIFRSGFLRTTCIALLILVSVWGLAYSFMGWFPCFPVSGFWNRLTNPPPKCYGFGFGSLQGAYAAFVSFAATNMTLDTIIFLIPMTEYMKPDLHRKQAMAMTGLFTLGFVVVLMSVLRLWTAIKHNPKDIKNVDFTWWYPLALIFSCLEVDFAIICASMPIFWPVFVASLPHIFVTKEVIVTHHQRNNPEVEVAERQNSTRGTNSGEGSTNTWNQGETHYTDQWVKDQVMGKIQMGVKVEGRWGTSG